jgi:hypothetical protein
MLHYYPRHVSSINMPIFRRTNCISSLSVNGCAVCRMRADIKILFGYVLKSFLGLFQHSGLAGLLYSCPNKFPHSSPEAQRIIQMRETSTSEGGNYPPILPVSRNLQESRWNCFTCPKAGTWDILFYFPSEGRHTEDFSDARKIQRV